jgi:uncharacterized membrane protein
MRWVLKRAFLLLLVLLALAQLVRFDRINPTIDRAKTIEATTAVPPEIHEILKRSCNDCHSNETIWPWYSRIAPVSWMIALDVQGGRGEINFSEWGGYTTTNRADKLKEICSWVRRGAMPDTKYTIIHRSARMTDEQRNGVCTWTEQTRTALAAESASTNPAKSSVESR